MNHSLYRQFIQPQSLPPRHIAASFSNDTLLIISALSKSFKYMSSAMLIMLYMTSMVSNTLFVSVLVKKLGSSRFRCFCTRNCKLYFSNAMTIKQFPKLRSTNNSGAERQRVRVMLFFKRVWTFLLY
ncbi:hypothetical protein Gasu2_12550 [Galdieria sulphuraria]|nr:hypothetical protein Gasu2_12550 [Galdieria sulphuraria]